MDTGFQTVPHIPPPATFNFTDTREYTVNEALDLMNQVLRTKGYTLVRRDKMLLVLNVQDGIPRDVVPHVTLDDLDDRGKYELVTVAFPLGNRDADTVQKELTPLLSKLGD